MLYTLSRSPNHCDLSALLRLMSDDDALLLLQDGVLAGLKNSTHLQLLCAAPISLYALQDDLEARGLVNYFPDKIIIIKYYNFVKLTEKHYCQMAW